jgi:hypothetical protein
LTSRLIFGIIKEKTKERFLCTIIITTMNIAIATSMATNTLMTTATSIATNVEAAVAAASTLPWRS